jgi:hypothetical protein
VTSEIEIEMQQTDKTKKERLKKKVMAWTCLPTFG